MAYRLNKRRSRRFDRSMLQGGVSMNKKWLASLNRNHLYKARQLQAISYLSIGLNIVLLLTLIWIMGG